MDKCCKGQSLVEVIVAVGAMSLLLVALLSLVSLSLRNSRLARDRAQAVALAQEGVELLRAYRDYAWSELVSLSNGTNYNLPENWVVEDGLSQGCISERQINNRFWRCVRLSLPQAGEVEVNANVSWPEGSQVFSAAQVTQLTLWER